MVMIGLFMGTLNSTLAGIAGQIGPAFLGANIQGIGLSSVVVCFVRLICLLSFDSAYEDSYFYSTILYFVINTVI